MLESRQIKCPICKKPGDWFATAWGPFCSRRCKLIDLGKWLGEENVISDPLPAGGEFSPENAPHEPD